MTRPGIQAEFRAPLFTCPRCEVVAQHQWLDGGFPAATTRDSSRDPRMHRSTCLNCNEHSYWVDGVMVSPSPRVGDSPSPDLGGEMLELYEEARQVAPFSPRAAAALLRLLVERLVTTLDPEAQGGLFHRIEALRTKGIITERAVSSLHSVRLGGNDAVHEGQIDPTGVDDVSMVMLLFRVINSIVESTLTLDREQEEFRAARAEARGSKGP